MRFTHAVLRICFNKVLFIAAALLTASGPVAADSLTLVGGLTDLGTGPTELISEDGLSIYVSANEVSNANDDAPFTLGDALLLIQSPEGLGAFSGAEDLNDDLGFQIDGLNTGEVLQFLFPMNVRLTRVFFGRVDPGDEFDLAISATADPADARDVSVDSSLNGDEIEQVGAVPTSGPGDFVVDLSGGVFFSDAPAVLSTPSWVLFQFHTQNSNDDFAIARIEFEE